MRALSSGQSIVTPPRAGYHFATLPVEAGRIESEFRSQLVAPWHSLPKAAKKNRPDLVQLAKAVGYGFPKNVCAQSATHLMVGSQDAARAILPPDELPDFTDLLRAPFEYMLGIVGARASLSAPHSIDELLAIETRIEGEVNDLQIAYALGGRTAFVRRQLMARIRKNVRILLDYLAKLEKEEHDESCGRPVEKH